MIIDWVSVTTAALQDLWQGFLILIPKIIGAVIIFLIGWFIAVGIGKLVTEILKRLQFDRIFEKGAWQDALKKAEFKVDASGFIGAIVKWLLVIAFLLAAVEVLGLNQFAGFLGNVVGYLPNVIVAALIFVVTVIITDIASKIASAGVEGVRVGYGRLVGTIVKWVIWIFAVLAILRQLSIVPEFTQTMFNAIVYGVVALVVIPLSIAFGLGGKDVAAEWLENFRKKLTG